MMKILPSNEIREIEAKANQSGISYLRLMETPAVPAPRRYARNSTRRQDET